MKHKGLWLIGAIVLLGAALPLLPTDLVRPRIERALERGLGRPVEIGDVHFTLFSGPGFTLDSVTIHEDARAGIEPFAYVGTLEARVQLLALLRRRFQFASLTLGDASINIVKTDAGPWNFQYLLGSPAAGAEMPAIKMRSGRVNFKFGDTKSVFYFNDADLDVSPDDDGAVEWRFSGAPSRTDHSAQDFGHFFVRGRSGSPANGQRLDLKVELEPSAVDATAHLFTSGGIGMDGVVSLTAQLSGPPSSIAVSGELDLADLHRSDLLPSKGSWTIPYKGTLDLRGEKLEIENVANGQDAPIKTSFHLWSFLTKPQWDVRAEVKHLALTDLVQVARRSGMGVPDKLTAAGFLTGSVSYQAAEGASGNLEMDDVSVSVPGTDPVKMDKVGVDFAREAIVLEPLTLHIGDSESADLEARYGLGDGAALDARVTTRGMNLAALHVLAAIPVFHDVSEGTWRGWVRYQGAADGGWTGEYELQNAELPLEGLADPLKIQSAAVSLDHGRVVVNRLRGKAGAIAFAGDYRWEPALAHSDQFHLTIPEVTTGELQRILGPTLVRDNGFLARTLGIGSKALPDWLGDRHAEGTLSIGSIKAGEMKLRLDSSTLVWDGASMQLTDLKGTADQAAVTGALSMDLAGRAPQYKFEGQVTGVPFKGGRLEFDGKLAAEGAGAALLGSAHGEGAVRGRSIAFTPEAEFRTANADFQLSAGGQWKLSNLEVVQGTETLTGVGTTQQNGSMLLELNGKGKPVRYSGTLFAPGARN